MEEAATGVRKVRKSFWLHIGIRHFLGTDNSHTARMHILIFYVAFVFFCFFLPKPKGFRAVNLDSEEIERLREKDLRECFERIAREMEVFLNS